MVVFSSICIIEIVSHTENDLHVLLASRIACQKRLGKHHADDFMSNHSFI